MADPTNGGLRLDEGPIIEQAVERVDHTMPPEQLTTLGNEIGC